MDDFNFFPNIIKDFENAIGAVVRKTAFDCQANIQARIEQNGQVDTGYMLNSVYVETATSSDYRSNADALPEIESPDDNSEAYIAVAASYAAAQNYGTVHMPPRPFFEPGVEKTRQSFEDALGAIEKRFREVAR